MTSGQPRPARPLTVTAICVVGAVAALATVALFLTSAPWIVPPTPAQRAITLVLVAVTVTALVGLWRMRRWGVWLLAALCAARVVYGFVAHAPWSPAALVGPALMLAVGLLYVRRMT